MVRYTNVEPSDDPQFLEWVEAVITGVEESTETDVRREDRQLVRQAMASLLGQITWRDRCAQAEADAASIHSISRRIAT